MLPTTTRAIHRRSEAGYTLLLVVFLVATMIIAAAVAAPSILTEGRRQKEEEMVWRGNQYARAVGLYYRKFRKFPTRVEDLTMQTNGVRFLRQAYTDPMNKEDGSWRFIYLGPNGTLIGSSRQTTLLQSAVGGAGMPGASSPFGGMTLPSGNGASIQQNGTAAPGLPVNETSSTTGSSSTDGQPQPIGGSGIGGGVIGGSIVGVGSKVDKSSIRVYLGADKYKDWEFIWSPFLQTGIPAQNPANVNGANPTTQQPPAPTANVPPTQ